MFDNTCKFLAESFPTDFATWLLGKPITLSKLSPTELSSEPIRTDSLILLDSDKLVLHLEFQTEPDPSMGFRMADYHLRVFKRFPEKSMRGTGSAAWDRKTFTAYNLERSGVTTI